MAHDVASLEIQVPVAQASDHVYLVSLVDPFLLRGLAPGPQLTMQILHIVDNLFVKDNYPHRHRN